MPARSKEASDQQPIAHHSRPYGVIRDQSRAVFVDYGVARRWVPKQPDDNSPDKRRLGAIRYPEMNIVFDNGDQEPLDIQI